MLAVAATGAALACLSLASATVAVVPAAIDLPGGTSVPTPSSTPQVNVPSVSVGPVQTPSATVPSEPLPSTGGDPPPPTNDPPRGGSGSGTPSSSGGSSSGGAQSTSGSSGSHTVRPLRPRPGGGSTTPGGDPSSHVRTGGGRSGAGARSKGARHRAAGAFGAAATPATGGLFGVPGSGPPAAGLSSRPLSRSAPLDVSVRHALSSVAHQVGRFDPRVAIREATGWRPSLVTMTLLVIAFGLLVFASGSVAIMRGGRDQRPAG